jgi:hypothetical protein
VHCKQSDEGKQENRRRVCVTTLAHRNLSLGPGYRSFLSKTAFAKKRLLPLVETVKNKLYARRNAQLIEDPKKVIAHDCGSTALGFAVAFLALDFWRFQPAAVTVPGLLFPYLLCALPLLDGALAVIRRLRCLTSPLVGDRRHFYDLLLARGYSPVEVALFCYLIAIALAGISWKERGMPPGKAVVVSAVSVAALAVVEIRLGSLQFGQNLRRPVVSLRAVSNKRAPTP